MQFYTSISNYNWLIMAETTHVTELQKRVNAQVVKYYNVTQEDYNKYYITDHRGMHYGYWDDSVKSHEESLAKNG